MDFATNSIIGKRENQEDYGVIKSLSSTDGVLAVISDGMGGQVAGEVASSTVVDTFVDSFISSNSKNQPLKLKIALEKANQNLAKSVKANPKLSGMGATLIAVHIDPRGLLWTSVGDSILYLYRHNRIIRLNEDHSMTPVLQESVRKGQLSESEARSHPHRNALRSAMTGEDISLIDLTDETYSLQDGDIVILSTDGLLTLSESEVCAIINKYKAQSANEIVDRLLQAVNAAGKPKQDNTLIQAVKVSGVKGGKFKLIGIITAVTIALASLGALLFSLDATRALFTNGFLGQAKTPSVAVPPIVIPPFQIELPSAETSTNSTSPAVSDKSAPAPQEKSANSPVAEQHDTKAEKKSNASKGVKTKEVGGTGKDMYVRPKKSEETHPKQESKPVTSDVGSPIKTPNPESVAVVPAVVPAAKETQQPRDVNVDRSIDAKVDSAASVKPTPQATEGEKPKGIPVEDRSPIKKSE